MKQYRGFPDEVHSILKKDNQIEETDVELA